LPEPETPVTQVRTPKGMRTVTSFRLWPAAPLSSSQPVGVRRTAGTAISRRPER